MRGLRAALAAVALLSIVACGRASTGSQDPPVAYKAVEVGSHRPATLADLRGQPVLLSSWASWCGECRQELPTLERLWQDPKRADLQIIAVNINDEGVTYESRRMISETGITMPIWSDPDDDFALAFGAIGVPTSVLLDSSGRVLHVWAGVTDFDDPDVRRIILASLVPAASSEREHTEGAMPGS